MAPLHGVRRWREDPFRIFFPLGYLLAILGLGLWIVDYLEPGFPHPGEGHAVLMMQGFAFAFSLGVFLTELPKSLGDISPPPLVHLILFPFLLLAMTASALVHHIGLSQVFFLLTLAGVLIYLGVSLILKRGPAHPDLVLMGLALLSALAGAVVWLVAEAHSLGAGLLGWARLAVYQGYFLLFAFSTFHWESPLAKTTRPRGRRALANTALGLLLIGFLTVEAFAADWFQAREGLALRLAHAGKAGLVLWFILFRVPRAGLAYQGAARWALYSILAGYALTIVFPARSVLLAHVTYVAGFCWLVLARASVLVALNRAFLLPAKRRGLWIAYGAMLLLGEGLRATADFFPKAESFLLLLAAVFVLLPLILWASQFLAEEPPPISY